MTNPTNNSPQESQAATQRLRLKPAELFGFAGVLGVFAGLIVLMSSRSFVLALIFTAIAFGVSLGFVALLGMGGKENKDDHGTGADS